MSDLSVNSSAVVSGSGNTTLVFLHYFGGSAQSWQWVTSGLSNYRCIALNLPGFGSEPASIEPTIAHFATYVSQQLRNLEVNKCVLIGHSMGGKVALQVAADQYQSTLINQLILLAPSPPTVERMPEEEKARMLIHPNEKEADITVTKGILKQINAEQRQLAINTQLSVDHSTWEWWVKNGMNHSIADIVKKITIPITVIISKDDPAVTYKMTMDDTMPNLPAQTKLIVTEKVGHLYPLEDSEWLSNLLIDITNRG